MMPVLVVDDSREDLALALRVFLNCKILNPIRPLHSGQQCIDYFERVGEGAAETLPCVVFLDLMMNPVSGIEVLRRLKNHQAAQGSVFVMLSGASDYAMVREGYLLGAATFVVKPLTCEEVLRTFRNLRGITFESRADGHVVGCVEHVQNAVARGRPSVAV
jgi:CheY-like chemotaxis protein